MLFWPFGDTGKSRGKSGSRAVRYNWDAQRMDTSSYPKPKVSELYQGLSRQQWRRGELLDRKEDRANARLQRLNDRISGKRTRTLERLSAE